MPQSPLRLIEKFAEFEPQDEIVNLPSKQRGIYVLYKKRRNGKYDVVYVGMAATGNRGGLKGRLLSHKRKKAKLWTHFTVFKVWDNIRDEEIKELEGLFRHIYSRDSQANKLNIQRGFRLLRRVHKNNLKEWSV